jgi:phosphopantetheinyl transferase
MLHYATYPKSPYVLQKIQEKYPFLMDSWLSYESQEVRYYLLQYLYSEYGYQWNLEKDKYGKPIPIRMPFSVVFETSQKESKNEEENLLYWSISHSQNHLAYIVSDIPTGIDIAEYEERDNSLLDIHSQSDYDQLSGKSWINFYTFWTAKECIIKLNGWQLDDMRLIQFISKESESILIFAFRQETYRIQILLTDELFIAHIL